MPASTPASLYTQCMSTPPGNYPIGWQVPGDPENFLLEVSSEKSRLSSTADHLAGSLHVEKIWVTCPRVSAGHSKVAKVQHHSIGPHPGTVVLQPLDSAHLIGGECAEVLGALLLQLPCHICCSRWLELYPAVTHAVDGRWAVAPNPAPSRVASANARLGGRNRATKMRGPTVFQPAAKAMSLDMAGAFQRLNPSLIYGRK